MPKKNIIKEYAPDTFYHIYSRGVNKNNVFLDEEDKTVFLSILKRYLSKEVSKDIRKRAYVTYCEDIDLLVYALMPNHFHLLVYQNDNERAITSFMSSLMISYGMYFNKKYKRQGPVFQSNYLASRIDKDSYLEYVSKYIHLNPDNWETTTDSSIDYYRGDRKADWIKPAPILELFGGFESYIEFLRDYDPDDEEEMMLFELDT